MSEKNNAAVCTAEKPAEACGFTPGPWHEGAGNGEGFIFGPEGCRRDLSGLSPVCRVNGSGPEDAANARLIAAAPEMYEALKHCKSVFENFDFATFEEFKPDYLSVCAALAAARGAH